MPTYCYRTSGGRLVELTMSATQMARRQVNGVIRARKGEADGVRPGQPLERDLAAEHGGFRNTPGNWPMKSLSCGVRPDQIPEAMAEDRRRGVAAEYDSHTGEIVWTSPGHRKRWCEAHGYFDRNAGYGDPRKGLDKHEE